MGVPSLLAWLATHSSGDEADWIWDHRQLPDFPDDLRRVIDHGRRAHHVIYGAALLYNLMVAELVDSEELTSAYRADLEEWKFELAEAQPLDGWDRGELWSLMRVAGRPVDRVRTFLEGWIRVLEAGVSVADDRWARQLVRTRESQLKGSRSRLTNPGAREQWSGGSGLVRLDFRWAVASRLLGDLQPLGGN